MSNTTETLRVEIRVGQVEDWQPAGTIDIDTGPELGDGKGDRYDRFMDAMLGEATEMFMFDALDEWVDGTEWMVLAVTGSDYDTGDEALWMRAAA